MEADRRSTDARVLDRPTLLTGLVLLATASVAWIGVFQQSVGMPASTNLIPSADALSDAAMFLAAWGVMMAAMMLPSATPMIVLYDRINRERSQRARTAIPTALFAGLYLTVWLGIGLLVYLMGVLLNVVADASPTVTASLPYALAAMLAATGLYQFSALKQSCLRQCRTPLSFLMARWRPGYLGTTRLALAHAAYCVGCCAGLMAILVAAGAMNLPWVLLIAAVVFIEKLLPRPELVSRFVGVAFLLLGIAVVLEPALASMLRGSSM